MHRISSRCSICLTSQNGRCTVIIEDPKVRMSRFLGYVYQNTNGRNHGPAWKTQSILLNEICTVILWQDGNACLFVNREEGLFFSVHVNDKKAGKTKGGPNVEDTLKDVDLGEPISFLLFDHVYFGCTQRECKTSKDIVDNHRDMFESRMSAGGMKNYTTQRNQKQTFPHGPMTWKVMQRNA